MEHLRPEQVGRVTDQVERQPLAVVFIGRIESPRRICRQHGIDIALVTVVMSRLTVEPAGFQTRVCRRDDGRGVQHFDQLLEQRLRQQCGIRFGNRHADVFCLLLPRHLQQCGGLQPAPVSGPRDLQIYGRQRGQ